MSKRDDIDVLYNKSKTLGKWCTYIFGVNCILPLLSISCEGQIQNTLVLIQVIGTILFVVIKNSDDGLFWYNAEMARRKNNIQVAFNLNLSELQTEGYYNNAIEPSILKYAVNVFESNFFSKFLAGKMLIKSIVKAIIAVIILIITAGVVPEKDVLLIITQAIFSTYIVEDTVMLTMYKLRMDKLYEEAYIEFVTLGIKEKKQEIWLLSYAVEYEAVKAYYKVRVDSNLFKIYNNELSNAWNDIIKKITITNNI